MDLFLRTHASAIQHDPVKVQALCGNVPITSSQCTNFLLWMDETLAAPRPSRLGRAFEKYLSPSMLQAFRVILDDRTSGMVDSTSTTCSMSDFDDIVGVSRSNDR